MRNRAADDTSDEEFSEYHSRAQEVKKQLQAAQDRLDITVTAYGLEKGLFEARGADEAAKEADKIFEDRSKTRKTEFDALKATLDTAKEELKTNKDAITELKAWLAANDSGDAAYGDKETELTTAENATDGL